MIHMIEMHLFTSMDKKEQLFVFHLKLDVGWDVNFVQLVKIQSIHQYNLI